MSILEKLINITLTVAMTKVTIPKDFLDGSNVKSLSRMIIKRKMMAP